jgi:hypothetical protein
MTASGKENNNHKIENVLIFQAAVRLLPLAAVSSKALQIVE